MTTTVNLISQSSQTIHLLDNHTISGAYHGDYGRAQFSNEQKTLLEQYYRANQFLTECLHHECYVSPEVRREIEETLLLPMAEIEKRQRKESLVSG